MNVILSRIFQIAEEKSTLLDVQKSAVLFLLLLLIEDLHQYVPVNITRVPDSRITSKTGLIKFNMQCKTEDYMLYTSL